jgi:hypothetical protein
MSSIAEPQTACNPWIPAEILNDPQWVWAPIPKGCCLADGIGTDEVLVGQQTGDAWQWLGIPIDGTSGQRGDIRRRLRRLAIDDVRARRLEAAENNDAAVAAIGDDVNIPASPDIDKPMTETATWSPPVETVTSDDCPPVGYWELFRPPLFHPFNGDRYEGPRLSVAEIVERDTDDGYLWGALMLRECDYTRSEAQEQIGQIDDEVHREMARRMLAYAEERGVWDWQVYHGLWLPRDYWPRTCLIKGFEDEPWPVDVRLGRPSDSGRRKVTLTSYSKTYLDKFDPSDGYQRQKLIENVAREWGLPKSVLGWLNGHLMREALRLEEESKTHKAALGVSESTLEPDARALDKAREILGDDFSGVTQHGLEDSTWSLHWGDVEISLDCTDHLYQLPKVRAKIGERLHRALPVDSKEWTKCVGHLLAVAVVAPGLTDVEVIAERVADYVAADHFQGGRIDEHRFDVEELGKSRPKDYVTCYDDDGKPVPQREGHRTRQAKRIESFVDLEGALWLKYSHFSSWLSQNYARATTARITKALRRMGFESDARLPGRKAKGMMTSRRYWRLEGWE